MDIAAGEFENRFGELGSWRECCGSSLARLRLASGDGGE
jgi:hypothetical protein